MAPVIESRLSRPLKLPGLGQCSGRRHHPRNECTTHVHSSLVSGREIARHPPRPRTHHCGGALRFAQKMCRGPISISSVRQLLRRRCDVGFPNRCRLKSLRYKRWRRPLNGRKIDLCPNGGGRGRGPIRMCKALFGANADQIKRLLVWAESGEASRSVNPKVRLDAPVGDKSRPRSWPLGDLITHWLRASSTRQPGEEAEDHASANPTAGAQRPSTATTDPSRLSIVKTRPAANPPARHPYVCASTGIPRPMARNPNVAMPRGRPSFSTKRRGRPRLRFCVDWRSGKRHERGRTQNSIEERSSRKHAATPFGGSARYQH